MRRRVVGLVLVMLLVGISFGALAVTITVPDDYPSIQAAIDAAQAGDTVYIKAGEYAENLVIGKPVQLIGEGRTDVWVEAIDHELPVLLIELKSGEVFLEGFSLDRGKSGVWIEVKSKAVVRLDDVLVSECDVGVVALGEGSVSIVRCLAVDNQIGLYLLAERSTIADTEICGGDLGVMLRGMGIVSMADCLVGFSEYGIHTYTDECGGALNVAVFGGSITGSGNRVFTTSGSLCPTFPGFPWPLGFVNETWNEAVTEVVSQYAMIGPAEDLKQSAEIVNLLEEVFAHLQKNGGFPLLEALIERDRGTMLVNLQRWNEALAALDTAYLLFAERGMELHAARTQSLIGLVHSALGSYPVALEYLLAARRTLSAYDAELEVAQTDSTIGTVYAQQEKNDEALEAYGRARDVFLANGLTGEAAVVEVNMATSLIQIGQYREALESYDRAEASFTELGIPQYIPGIQINRGVIWYHLGRYEMALSAYHTGLRMLLETELWADAAGAYVNIGVVYDELRLFEEALVSYDHARAIYVQESMHTRVADVDANIAHVFRYLGRFDEALDLFAAAQAVYAENEMEIAVAEMDENIGAVYADLKDYDRALPFYEQAKAIYQANNRAQRLANVINNIGMIWSDLGEHDMALTAYREAEAILEADPEQHDLATETRMTIYNNLGLSYHALGQFDLAVVAYERAVAILEDIRGDLQSEHLKAAFQSWTRTIYEGFIELCIQMGQGSSAFIYAERCRARTFLDALYQGGITADQLISPEAGISSGAVDPEVIAQAVADARESLQPNEAVLEYMVTDSGVYVWVVTADGIAEPDFIDYPRAQLMNDVITLRQAIEGSNSDPITTTQFLQSFYEKLIQGSLTTLSDSVDTLIIIPSGPLWYLPFSALLMVDREAEDSTGVPYLVEAYTLAYLPSLASLPSLAQEDAVVSTSLLALADPERSLVPVYESGESPCGDETELGRYEALVIACHAFAKQLVGEEQETQFVYAGEEAQEVLAHQDSGRQVVVYAAHGQFNPYVPLQSKLLLATGEEGTPAESDSRVTDGNYHAWEVLLTDYRGTELVVLAACETLLPHLKDVTGTMAVLSNQECDQVELTPQQLEQIVVGDEVVGLARAFLSSGAEAVVGTLWLANPYAIGELLTYMADYHNQGDPWVQALTKAQRDLIANSTFGNVWYWAPYQLIGRWR